ncbi:MAG TPA: SDR family NAD(P)-dependent oxidoreductase [Anaerolineales bacterium]|nr:SDR family NAD(P)-dependent oxidoreductase [Anaerolineales bacterium]
MEFQDKVVLITGAGRGTGHQMAEAFAAQGARLAINDVTPQNVESLAVKLRQRGYNAKVYVDDIAKKVAVQALINQVEDDFGRIDVLINHASVEPHTPLLDMDEWDWHRTLDVNLTGAFLAMQSVGRIMRERGGGVIVNMASLSGGTVSLDRVAYVASLFGIVGLTLQAARELFSNNIRVHMVGRGLGRFQNTGTTVPSELSRAALFLCSPRAAHLTGHIVNLP